MTEQLLSPEQELLIGTNSAIDPDTMIPSSVPSESTLPPTPDIQQSSILSPIYQWADGTTLKSKEAFMDKFFNQSDPPPLPRRPTRPAKDRDRVAWASSAVADDPIAASTSKKVADSIIGMSPEAIPPGIPLFIFVPKVPTDKQKPAPSLGSTLSDCSASRTFARRFSQNAKFGPQVAVGIHRPEWHGFHPQPLLPATHHQHRTHSAFLPTMPYGSTSVSVSQHSLSSLAYHLPSIAGQADLGLIPFGANDMSDWSVPSLEDRHTKLLFDIQSSTAHLRTNQKLDTSFEKFSKIAENSEKVLETEFLAQQPLGHPHPTVASLVPPRASPTELHADPQLKELPLGKLPSEKALLEAIRVALAWQPPPYSKPPFNFKLSDIAARTNAEILESHGYDIHAALHSDPSSPLFVGAEFRPESILRPIFGWHPFWHNMRSHIYDGVTYPLQPISEEDRLQDLDEAIAYGNHKSARKEKAFMMAELNNEVKRGWQLPIPVKTIHKFPGAVVSPMGCAHHMKLQPDGSRKPAKRLTHDMSMPFSSGQSPNIRVIKECLTNCVFGFTLRRHLHHIVALRNKYPHARLVQSKADFKSAFRRLQAAAELVQTMITTTKGLHGADTETVIALLCLRLTFGGSPNPSIFNTVSESVTDVANTLLRCSSWDQNELRSSNSDLVQEPKYAPDNIPLAPGRPLLVDVPVDEQGKLDVFIDDVIGVQPVLEGGPPPDRTAQATLLVIEVAGRPTDPANDPLPRNDLLAIDKAAAEITPAEVALVLGWLIDTRSLLMSLPDDKYLAWKSDIERLLNRVLNIHFTELDTLIGRLQNVCFLIPQGNHYMSNLRAALARAKYHGWTHLTYEECQDLVLWLKMLAKANAGLDINNLVFREPDHIWRGDACEYQLGGFNVTTGRAWRWFIPEKYHGVMSINFLEFITAGINVHLGVLEDQPAKGDAFLNITDSCVTDGWMPKSNFSPEGEHSAHFRVARDIGGLTYDREIAQWSLWQLGKDNAVADLLSRDCHSSDAALTSTIIDLYPSQVPANFRVSPLPPQIISQACSWLQLGMRNKVQPPQRIRVPAPAGGGGKPSSPQSNSRPTPTSKNSQHSSATESLAPMHSRSVTATTANPARDTINWLREHAAPPSVMWHRDFIRLTGPTQDRIHSQEKLRSFLTGS